MVGSVHHVCGVPMDVDEEGYHRLTETNVRHSRNGPYHLVTSLLDPTSPFASSSKPASNTPSPSTEFSALDRASRMIGSRVLSRHALAIHGSSLFIIRAPSSKPCPTFVLPLPVVGNAGEGNAQVLVVSRHNLAGVDLGLFFGLSVDALSILPEAKDASAPPPHFVVKELALGQPDLGGQESDRRTSSKCLCSRVKSPVGSPRPYALNTSGVKCSKLADGGSESIRASV